MVLEPYTLAFFRILVHDVGHVQQMIVVGMAHQNHVHIGDIGIMRSMILDSGRVLNNRLSGSGLEKDGATMISSSPHLIR